MWSKRQSPLIYFTTEIHMCVWREADYKKGFLVPYSDQENKNSYSFEWNLQDISLLSYTRTWRVLNSWHHPLPTLQLFKVSFELELINRCMKHFNFVKTADTKPAEELQNPFDWKGPSRIQLKDGVPIQWKSNASPIDTQNWLTSSMALIWYVIHK